MNAWSSAALAVLCVCAATRSAGSAGQEATLLLAEQRIERSLGHGETHRYQLSLNAGEYVHASVEQHGIDLVVRVLGPNAAILAEFQDDVTTQGHEDVELVAASPGTYTLSIAPAPGIITSGAYAIQLVGRRAATDADRTLQEARTLRASAAQRIEQDDAAGAVRLLDQALSLTERVKGPDDREVGDVAAQMANACFDARDMRRAEQVYGRAIAILEKTYGANHPVAAYVRARLARVYRVTGQRLKAEALVRPALEAIEKTLGTDHLFYVAVLGSLAALRDDASDYKESVAIGVREVAILEKLQYTDSFEYAVVLNNIGSAYLGLHDADHAEPYLRRSIAVFEKVRGPDSYPLSSPLANLGRLLAAERDDYPAAEVVLTRALAIRERAVGPDNPDLMLLLNNLANVYLETRDHASARALYFRVLRIGEHAYGSYDRIALLANANIAETYKADGDVAQAIVYERRTQRIAEARLALNLATGSERQKLASASSLADRTDQAISLHLLMAPADADAASLAALVVMQRKGRVLDAMTDTFARVRQHLATPTDREIFDQLQTTTAQLASVSLTATDAMTPEERLGQIKTLEARKEQLESELGDRSAEFRAQTRPVTLDAIEAALPESAALVEFAVFRPFNPQARLERDAYGPRHYAAYVIHKDVAPHGVDLGPAAAIDEAIQAFRQSVSDPTRGDVMQRARAFDARILQPLRASIGRVTRLLISPDGDLNLVPFDALVDERGRFLIQRYAMTYLTSGRDLLRMQVPRVSGNAPVIVADPFFGEPSDRTVAPAVTAAASRPARRRSVTTAADLGTMYFAPLAGTASEARAIQTLFPEATVFTGRRATKANLQQVDAPNVLHIASHGFFLREPSTQPSPSPPPSPTTMTATRGISATARVENPLLRSGLALAGANLTRTITDDGILTALEASGLNLWGTKLVTLSACESGMGEVRNGEGVYGLRRAFVLAGAETVVMSLWAVSDGLTREMMITYYKGLRAGQGRADALRRAKLTLLARAGRRHPFYWAGFIQSGEWASLSGER